MIDLNNIHTLTDFQRNTKTHIKRLKRTGKPEVLTVNGRAEVVVQSADAYQALLDQADLLDSAKILKERIADADAGAEGVPIDKALDLIRRRLGLRES